MTASTASHWHDFLTGRGAHRDDKNITCFGPAAADPDDSVTRLMDLSQLAILLVTGPDARKFMQGQVTCDIDGLTAVHSISGAHCNLKGRMLFSFRALDTSTPTQEQVALILAAGLLDQARQALQKYIVFSKAELSVEPPFQLLGLSGPGAAELLAMPGAARNGTVSSADNRHLVQIAPGRYLCLVEKSMAQDTWSRWAEQATEAGGWQWEYENIRDGLGVVLPGAEALFLPQVLNYDITGGVSFTKGCYVGQEVVARMHYKGQLKRHMRRARCHTEQLPPPGTPVFVPEKSQSVGNLVSAAPVGDRVECLLVVTDTVFEKDPVSLGDSASDMAKLEWLPLPYSLD